MSTQPTITSGSQQPSKPYYVPDEIKSPGIIDVSRATDPTAPPFDHTRPVKTWVDTNVPDSPDPGDFHVYTCVEMVGTQEQLVPVYMTAHEAATRNLPPVGAVTDPAIAAALKYIRPIPIRPLLPNESFDVNPFADDEGRDHIIIRRNDMGGGPTTAPVPVAAAGLSDADRAWLQQLFSQGFTQADRDTLNQTALTVNLVDIAVVKGQAVVTVKQPII